MSGCGRKAPPGNFCVMNTAEKGPKNDSIIESKDNPGPPCRPQDENRYSGAGAEAESMKEAAEGRHYMKLTGRQDGVGHLPRSREPETFDV